jgi:alkanesulfonate monooxygenase SsuD/methylene tetrahydromethanopterin reductase-like flavin-dependent oxidoreductase (luciferase family)
MRFAVLHTLTDESDAALEAALRAGLMLAARAEQLGYEALWLDWRPASSLLPLSDALLLAAALLGRTHRLQVGLIGAEALLPHTRAGGRALLDLLFEARFGLADRFEQVGPVRQVALLEDEAAAGRARAAARAAQLPADSLLIGGLEAVAARLTEQEARGPERLLLLDFGLAGDERARLAALERFGRELLPRYSPQPLIPPTLA